MAELKKDPTNQELVENTELFVYDDNQVVPKRSKRTFSDEKLRKMKMEAGHGGGPGSHFGGLKEKPKNVKGIINRLISYISYSKVVVFWLILTAVILTLLSLSVNIFLEKMISSMGIYDFEANHWGIIVNNELTSMPDQEQFRMMLIILIIIYSIVCLLQFVCNYMSGLLQVAVIRKMRNDLFSKIVKLPISYTDSHPHGDLMSRMINDVDNISNAIGQSLVNIISGVITLIGCVFIMLYFSPLLTVVSLVTLGLSLLITFLMSKFMGPLFTKQQSILGLLNTQTEEMVSGCKTVIAYNHQETAVEEFEELSNDLCHTAIKAQIWGGSMGPIMNFIGNLGYFLVCFFGALFISKQIGGTLLGGILTPAIVITFLTLNKQFTRPINEIAQLYSSLLTAMAGGERVFKVMDEETEDFTGIAAFDPEKTTGYIEFNHIGFSYVEGKPVLKDFSVDVRSGHKIALVGATGSGKTTIVNLLLRFYDVTSGEICIDGINIKDMSKRDLRDAISIVLQDAVLFRDTIENNIKYGKNDATDEEFWNAVKLANCESFIKRLPEQEKTILTEGATNISQGQRQLLTIARAVLANPKILILDEATSSVDTRTEKKIQDAMINLMKNRTSIIIAHRLSTIQDADLIVVLDGGVVVEMGNHQELIEKDGVYNRLYQTQFSGLNT